MPTAAPATRISRPAALAGLSASPVITSQAPTARNVAVISHRLTAPTAASALTVSVTGSKDGGCNVAAIVDPPTSSTGAAAEESTPHHGTFRITPP